MNYKKSFKAAGVAALALGTVAWSEAAQASYVTLNGQPLATSVAPITRSGRTLVPMRDIFEALGATVQWNSLTQGIVATRGTTAINMQIGNRVARVNSQQVRLDHSPMLYRGSTMVPLRFVSEALGARVNWNNARQIAAITTAGSTASAGTAVSGVRSITVPAGAVVPVTLDSTLSSASAKVRDTFLTTVVSTNPGDSEFPSGTKIEGVVTEVRRKTATSPGLLDVDFRAIVLPTGERYPLRGRLSALDDDSVTQESEGRIVAKSSTKNKDRVKLIGIGAGAGFLIGKVLLKQNGILSAVLGAAGGYLYSQSKSKNRLAEVNIAPGTKLGVQVDRPMTYTDASGYAQQRAPYIR
ncbi:MAG TPA: copper amine oxidase N-terminal domain-containing protein [Abditibacteriaceae bacterium]|nr:copper amine oxidase N-terminal domain-containing protein [Abditibacteriaceae bacterium]